MPSRSILLRLAAATALLTLSLVGHQSKLIGLAQAASTPASPSAAITLNEIFISFQTTGLKGRTASSYYDVHNSFKRDFTAEDAARVFDFMARNADEILSFYTDKEVDRVEIEIIRITNRNEYNRGSGFTKLGKAVLERRNKVWVVGGIALGKAEMK